MINATDKQPDKEMPRVRSSTGALSLWSLGASPTWHVAVFTNLETPGTLYCWDFYRGFIMSV